MKASDQLRKAADLIEQRGVQRDTPEGERSMARAVSAFNAIFGHHLTETEGWEFMCLLKKARKAYGVYTADDYEDDIAYAALAAESESTKHGS